MLLYSTDVDKKNHRWLTAKIIANIGKQMQSLREETAALQATEPPKDFTAEQITVWLNAVKTSPDNKAIHLLVERIGIKNKTLTNITSTLKTVLGRASSNVNSGYHTLLKRGFELSFIEIMLLMRRN